MENQGKLRRTRREAAKYISEHYFPCAVSTLAKLAVIGGGPLFQRAGRSVLYTTANLDDWALGQIGPEVRTTAELPRTGAKPPGRPRKLAADQLGR